MNSEQNHILEFILDELKNIRAELQLLRQELREKSSDNPDVAQENLSPSNNNDKKNILTVQDWIANRGITVKHYREQSAADAVFDRLATFLGEHFRTLSRFYEALKRSLISGNSVTLNVASSGQKELAELTQFCTMLHSYAFLSSYKYNKNTKTIFASPNRTGIIINFFTGEWFERYVYLKISSLISQNGNDFTVLINPKITFPNGGDFEFDLFFLVAGKSLWVECKTGDYQSYIARYAAARKTLNIPQRRAILVILGISNDLATHLTHLYNITVANEETFSEAVTIAIRSDESQKQTDNISTGSSSLTTSNDLLKLLNKRGLRPLPEYRHQVISVLIAMVESFDKPHTMAEVKAILAEKVPISKSQLQHILNAIVRSNCVLDDNSFPVLSFTLPFSNLISNDPAVIESKCIEIYVHTVLLIDPDYFNNPDHIVEFQRVIGSNVLDMELIRKIKERLSLSR